MLAGELAEFNASRAVYLLANCLNLLGDGEVKVIKESEAGLSLASRDDCLSKGKCTSTTLRPVVADYGSVCTRSKSLLADEVKLSRSIRTTLK